MRLSSSRWLLVTGLLAALGGCHQAEKQCCCEPVSNERLKPVPTPDVLPLERPRTMPSHLPAVTAPVSAPPKYVVTSPVPKPVRPQAPQVENKAVVGPRLSHAPDHSWLVGRLERDEAKNHWYVRYADPGANERLGGRLELVGTGPMAGFRVGQAVRAEGNLLDPAPFQTQPAYRIRSLQALPQ